jgi:hypothetical protein
MQKGENSGTEFQVRKKASFPADLCDKCYGDNEKVTK